MCMSVCVCSMSSGGVYEYRAMTEEHTDCNMAQEDTEMEKDSL